jgi:chromosome segregation ATPase
MKNPLQTLLIFFALCLCGLCSWQWYCQVNQQKEFTTLAQTGYEQAVAIQTYTNSINNMHHQIAQMDARLTELRSTVISNNAELATLRLEKGRLTSLVEQYSNAVVTLQIRLKQANDGINHQNDTIKSLVTERDELVKRLNESIRERNEVVSQYNALVKRVEEQQAKPPGPPNK